MLHLTNNKNTDSNKLELNEEFKRLGYAKDLWWERYRPQKVDDVCMPQALKDAFNTICDGNIPQNLLLVGSPGTGKTTLMNILTKNRSTLYINASLERGIDTIRNKIVSFGQISTLTGKSKVVALDEVDQVTKDGQLALRGTIEKIAKTTRFLATCNYPDQLDDAIKSRFQIINFDFSGEHRNEVVIQRAERIKYICSDNGLSITNEALILLLDKFDDMRSIINSLQTAKEFIMSPDEKVIKPEHLEQTDAHEYSDFYEVLFTENDLLKIRSFATQNYSRQELKLIDALGNKFITWVSKKHPELKNLAALYVLSHKYGYESKQVSDPLTSLMALIAELKNIIQ